MLNPYDLWLIKKWPQSVSEYVNKYFLDYIPIYEDTSQIYRSDTSFFNGYRDQNIIVIGGGLTTKKINWNPQDYDYLWSCNNYFLNKNIEDLRIHLAMIMPGVDLKSKVFLDRIERDQPLIGFELHDQWFNSERLKELDSKYDNSRMFFSHTRFFGKLGVGARMLILAASLGAKSVSFIGFDGPVPGHSFEEGKFKLPADITQENAWDIYTYQYNELYNHLETYFPNTKIISIDKTNKLHEKVCHI